jgi:PIF1 helicase.
MTDKKGHECEFPMILSFPVLVTKSQGHSFDDAVIYLLKGVFRHSHLIVVLKGNRNHWNVKVVRDMH